MHIGGSSLREGEKRGVKAVSGHEVIMFSFLGAELGADMSDLELKVTSVMITTV
jgi:hypothetical protein